MAADTELKNVVDPETNRGHLELRTINVPGRVFAWTVGDANRGADSMMPDLMPGYRRGPWDEEPDEVRFVEEVTGYTCIIRRGWRGGLCGYVELPAGHPLVGHVRHNADFERKCRRRCANSWPIITRDDPRSLVEVIDSLEVPGIVTFAEQWNRYSWCIGFGHSHLWDGLPGSELGTYPSAACYANIEQVGRECAALARQLNGVAEGVAEADDDFDDEVQR